MRINEQLAPVQEFSNVHPVVPPREYNPLLKNPILKSFLILQGPAVLRLAVQPATRATNASRIRTALARNAARVAGAAAELLEYHRSGVSQMLGQKRGDA